jgi:hypothetical protein
MTTCLRKNLEGTYHFSHRQKFLNIFSMDGLQLQTNTPQTHARNQEERDRDHCTIMAQFEEENDLAMSSDFNDFEEEQVAELEDTDDWGKL